MKKVLVTGASGFIGRSCLSLLTQAGYEVHAVSYTNRAHPLDGPVRWHCSDLLNPVEVSNLILEIKPKYLLHFAWFALPGQFWTSPENLEWVKATATIMRAFYNQGGQRLVVAGTCAEYDWAFGHCSESSTPCRPETLYGVSKFSTQILLEAWAKQTGMSSAWGRIFFLYCPNEYSSRLVPYVTNSLLNGIQALCSHGEQVRDFMHVDDVAAAFVALLGSDVQGAVNIASGSPVRIKDIVHQIADQLNRRSLVRLGAITSNQSEPGVLTADISRLRNEVNFRPHYRLEDGLKQTVDSIKASRV